jgi:hypothetical protein
VVIGPLEYRLEPDPRQRARLRRDWAAWLNLQHVDQQVEELDKLETGMLFDIQTNAYLFDHRVRRLAEEIAEWRAEWAGKSRYRSFTDQRGQSWPDYDGVPYSGVPFCKLWPRAWRLTGESWVDQDSWYEHEVMRGVADARPSWLFYNRRSGRYLGRFRGQHNLRYGIDQALHASDNTVRFP